MKNCGFQCKIQLQTLSAERHHSPLTALRHYSKPVASDAKPNHKFHEAVADQEQTSAVAMALPESEPLAAQCPGVTERVCFLLSA